MKRITIIFLILIFGLCLATNAFAEDYMVICIEVDSGNIAEVYGANKVGSPAKAAKMSINVNIPKYHTDNQSPHGKPLIIKNILSEKSFKTIYATSSPGCRYIFYNGRYVKICK